MKKTLRRGVRVVSMTKEKASAATNGNRTKLSMYEKPPEPAALNQKAKVIGDATTNAKADVKREIKLLVDMPLKADLTQTNDVAWYFKRFAAAILQADDTLSILNWKDPEQNPIVRAGDIKYEESTVKQYFEGMKIIQSRRRIQGFMKV